MTLKILICIAKRGWSHNCTANWTRFSSVIDKLHDFTVLSKANMSISDK